MSNEGEIRDFMSVDSFSQLPFIRTTPIREKTTRTSTAIRLFGIEVPQDLANNAQKESSSSTTITDSVNANTNGSRESGRKFKCQYCCRNFPTSQALGGHQNAHKRERQHAKRAQFQPAIARHHQHQASYSLLNYHRSLGGAGSSPPSGHYYPSWINSSSTTSRSLHVPRFYGGPGSMSEPINGSPLPVHGGVAMIQWDRMMPLPSRPVMGVEGRAVLGTATSYYGSSNSSQSVQATVKDSLSLDLHL